jgi:hypothetical protein
MEDRQYQRQHFLDSINGFIRSHGKRQITDMHLSRIAEMIGRGHTASVSRFLRHATAYRAYQSLNLQFDGSEHNDFSRWLVDNNRCVVDNTQGVEFDGLGLRDTVHVIKVIKANMFLLV